MPYKNGGFMATCPHCAWDLATLQLGGFTCLLCGKSSTFEEIKEKNNP